MKLLLKTITGKQQEVEVEPSTTILDVKKFVEDEYEPASLRLCYNGAVLEDSKTVADAGVREGESLVLAGRKRKIPKPPAQPPTVQPKAEPSSAAAMVNSETNPSSLMDVTLPSDVTTDMGMTAATTTEGADPSSEAANAVAPPSSFLVSAAPSTAPVPGPVAPTQSSFNTFGAPTNLIDEVCSMGFGDRNQVALALRAAFMNVDRAVEYLFDGIPPHLLQELTRDSAPVAPAPAPMSTPAAPSTAPTAPESGATQTTAPAPSTPVSELRAALAGIPQFDQIRALYLRNTETLPVVTQQIALHHPAVYELIERNPEAFLAIMSETGSPGTAEGAPSQSGGAAVSTAHGTTGNDGEGGLLNMLPEELELTAEDRAAVQQLVELGGGVWDEQNALLVYLATRRNQEVAASILFEHGGLPPELLAAITNQLAEGEEYEEDDEQQ
ncbi:Uv excision repair RAD23-like protein [Leptomonas seymouri]|uniref:UV excision repair protein RAD23 n=1 Tax=Leptomonas seymouri TaxID=5684 RepID=A0A0N1PC65_LEPSE|nr:Uv excision repair RAD23-like protein [Leptomonas seymouri]|eukprot:KPI84841.1 Uv excision repair RAD23-like protein [Leptomonas seymouri]